MIGSINDQILNKEELACRLICFLEQQYPGVLSERFQAEGFKDRQLQEADASAVLEQIARARACLLKGGELDVARAASLLLEDFRSGKLGRITLELPESRADKKE